MEKKEISKDKKILIILIIVVITAIIAIIVAMFATGKFGDLFNESNGTVIINETTAEVTESPSREKITTPPSCVSVIYTEYTENCYSDIDNLASFGFNSVLFLLKTDSDYDLGALVNYARDKGIYTGIYADGKEPDAIKEFTNAVNYDMLVVYNLDESDKDFSKNAESIYTTVKSIDSATYIGFEPTYKSDICDGISVINSDNCCDFVFLKQTGISDTDFESALSFWSGSFSDVVLCFSLAELDNITDDYKETYFDMISEARDSNQCFCICFDNFSYYNSCTSSMAKSVKNYIISSENYLENKELEISSPAESSVSTDSSVISFTGTGSPLQDITCNGEKVITADNGDFSYDIKLSAGKNTVTFVQGEKKLVYTVTYNIDVLKSVSPTNGITVPGGIDVEVKALAHKDATLTVSFNGKSYKMTKGENDDQNGEDTSSDFSYFYATLETPAGKSKAQSLGAYTVSATYNGVTDKKTGGTITVSANVILTDNEPTTKVSTSTKASTTKSTTAESTTKNSTEGTTKQQTTGSITTSRVTKETKTTESRVTKSTATTKQTEASTSSTTETTTKKESTATTTKAVSLQQYVTTENYGLGTAKYCVIADDYVEVYPGSSTSTKSVPDCTPLLKGTTDYVTNSAVLDDDNIIYYFLSSGVKVPQYREENLSSGKQKVTNVNIIDGYKMPTNNIQLVSSKSVNGDLVITLAMNRLVAFNCKLIGQTYSKYDERIVSVSKPDCTGLQIVFSDTNKFSGSLSFSGGIVANGTTSVSGTTTTLNLNFANAGKFYGYHYEYSNGNLKITIKGKPSSLSGYTIMLDPGHGGRDPGASCVVSSSTWSEKKINLSLALKVKELLEAEGATVIMTRSDDSFVSLLDRTLLNRKKLPDMFISIHCDSSSSSSAYGTSAYYYRAYSQPLAKCIHEALVSTYKSTIYSGSTKSNVDRKTSFYAFKVARVEECPSVLIEYGFVSNTEECEILQNATYRDALAKATVTGIKNYISGY